MIEIQNLSKSYGAFKALDDLSLSISKGEIFGFIGPNGAGKSTTIKILTGLLQPSSGEASIDSIDCRSGSKELRLKVGYMPDNFGVYGDLNVWEYLDFFCAAYRLPKKARKETIERVLDITSSMRIKDFKMGALSKGMKQKAGLAKTLLHDPEVVILDEPSSGLDPRARIEMRELIRKLKSMEKTVMVSSHILSELADISDQIGIIEKGKLLASGSVEEVMETVRQELTYECEVIGNASRCSKALALIEKKGLINSIEQVSSLFTFNLRDADPETANRVLLLLVKNDISLKAFRPVEADLEEVFMRVTQQHGNES
jgi:ABC-2 type transport system ATP-binding protein